MAVVFIPALLRDLTGGAEQVEQQGETLRQVIDGLEARFPGIRERLFEGERLRPGIAVFVDGELSHRKLRHKLEPGSEVHFLPAISGG